MSELEKSPEGDFDHRDGKPDEWWGLRPPDVHQGPAWGARAIYALENEIKTFKVRLPKGRRGTRKTSKVVARVELLHDRQSTRGDAVNLCEWVEAHGLPAIRKLCAEQYLTGDSAGRVTFSGDYGGVQYAIAASPRQSCGYLYLCAWQVTS